MSSSSSEKRTRSRSPVKKKVVDTSSDVYQAAMNKVVIAASKFNRETTAGALWLKSIENRQLDKEQFRGSLRSGMNCRLTVEEFDAWVRPEDMTRND